MDEHSHTDPPSEPALRIKALESILVERGFVDPEAIDGLIDVVENRIGPRNGAQVVAHAWVDPDYKARLLEDGSAGITELGLLALQAEHLVVLENTPEVHNVVVCTLCSCYPWPVLGMQPSWYKSAAYRSRVVIEPRRVLAEFGLDVPDEVEVRVWDSNADIRYMVLPIRPEGTGVGREDELVELVTRDSMIGTSIPTVEP